MSKASKKPGYSFINMQDVLRMRDPDKAIDRVQRHVDDEICRLTYGCDYEEFQRRIEHRKRIIAERDHREFVLRSVC